MEMEIFRARSNPTNAWTSLVHFVEGSQRTIGFTEKNNSFLLGALFLKQLTYFRYTEIL